MDKLPGARAADGEFAAYCTQAGTLVRSSISIRKLACPLRHILHSVRLPGRSRALRARAGRFVSRSGIPAAKRPGENLCAYDRSEPGEFLPHVSKPVLSHSTILIKKLACPLRRVGRVFTLFALKPVFVYTQTYLSKNSPREFYIPRLRQFSCPLNHKMDKLPEARAADREFASLCALVGLRSRGLEEEGPPSLK